MRTPMCLLQFGTKWLHRAASNKILHGAKRQVDVCIKLHQTCCEYIGAIFGLRKLKCFAKVQGAGAV